MARKNLIERVPIPRTNVFPMPSEMIMRRKPRLAYAHNLPSFFPMSQRANPPRFDLIFLGMGRDGHTASLFPFAEALDVTDAWVTWTNPGTLPPLVDRITLTYPVLNAARQVVFLVSGKDKATALRDVLERRVPRQDRPAAGVQPVDGPLIWFIDDQAAGLLTRSY